LGSPSNNIAIASVTVSVESNLFLITIFKMQHVLSFTLIFGHIATSQTILLKISVIFNYFSITQPFLIVLIEH